MPVSAIFAGAASSLRTRAPSAIFAGVVTEARRRAPSAIFVADNLTAAPDSALSSPHSFTNITTPNSSLAQPFGHSVDVTPNSALSAPFLHEVAIQTQPTSALYDHFANSGGLPDTTSGLFDHPAAEIPSAVTSGVFDHDMEVLVAGIAGKQIATGTRGVATANIVDDAVTSAKLAAGAVDSDAIATGIAGNGLTGGGGSALSVQPNNTDDGGVSGLEVAANGLRVGAALAGNGLSKAAGAAMTVDADTGIAVTGSGVSFDTTANLTMTGIHSHTPNTLQVTGTPDSANDAVNKAYVDSTATGLQWLAPVLVRELIGSDAALDIEGLSPTTGDAYVVDTANGVGDLSGATVGDIWEYDGAAWNLIIAGSGGFVASGVRALASIQTALNGTIGLTDGVDDGKVLQWDGASLTPATIVTPTAGDALLVTDQDNDGDSIFANLGYTYQGTVPTGVWTQFTGAGQINAGDGLSKTGNTLNVGAGNGITANANDVAVNPDSTTGGNIQPVNVVANGVGLDVAAVAGTGLEADGSANLRLATQGTGISGGGGSTLSFDATAVDGNGLSGAGSTLSVDAADASITVGASGINVNPAALIDGGAQEIDADLLAVSQVPTNYTRSTAGEATALDQLAAHLRGIDDALTGAGSTPTQSNKNMVASVTTSDGDQATATAIASTPINNSYVKVEVNGIGYTVGDGVLTTDCYFSGDGGTTARTISAIVATDTLHWNGSISGFQLDGNDRVDFFYDV